MVRVGLGKVVVVGERKREAEGWTCTPQNLRSSTYESGEAIAIQLNLIERRVILNIPLTRSTPGPPIAGKGHPTRSSSGAHHELDQG